MHRLRLSGVVTAMALAALFSPSGGAMQTSVSPDEALKRASAGEEKLKAAKRDYNYRQEILVQTLGEAGSVSGQYHRVSDIIYDDLGNRSEKIVEFPPSRLTRLLAVMRPDFKSILGVDPFFLTPDLFTQYEIRFVERQKIDEISALVFDVEPTAKAAGAKRKQGEARPFNGRIWIEDQEFFMVKAESRAYKNKEDREQFPKFEYYREYVDDKFWLPSYVYGDDLLDMRRYDLPIRVKIKYTDYKRAPSRR